MKCKYCGENFATSRGLEQHRVEIVDKRKYKTPAMTHLCLFLGFIQDTLTHVWKVSAVTTQPVRVLRAELPKPRPQARPQQGKIRLGKDGFVPR